MNISFFIPAYNCATTIAESVHSIMETNFAEGDELVIANDCATDGTADVLQQIKARYPKIKLVTHTRNKGGAAARNTAIENTGNSVLFCLDADNVLERDSIDTLKTFMEDNAADVACFNELRYFSESTSTVDETWTFEPGVYTIEDLLSGKLPPGASGNYMFTKASWEKAKGYSEDMGALDTWSFGFKQLMEGSKMMVMPGSYYFHRRGHNSYYLRDAWNKRRSVSLRLIKLIINYIDRIHPDDVNYIFSSKGRYSWFDNLAKRPIRLDNSSNGSSVWEEHEIKKPFWEQKKDKAMHYKTRLAQVIKTGSNK